MKIHFLGANRQVTGSRYLLEAAGCRVLVDCGLFQERAVLARNWAPPPVEPATIDAVVLTHAHLDHCGLIPKLVHDGFRGPIVCTRPTVDLARIVMEDSAEIQEEDALYKRRRHRKEKRVGPHPEQPLYTLADAQKASLLLRPTAYRTPYALADELTVTFQDAGHILGSSSVEFRIGGGDRPRVVLFSGDIGQPHRPLIRDPWLPTAADWVVMESTYGDREHPPESDIEHELAEIITATVRRGGNVVIPTFAVERAQELMYHLSRLAHAGRIPPTPVFLDSPMAVDVTNIFLRYRDCLDDATWKLIAQGEPPLQFPGLTFTPSAIESRKINQVRSGAVIMASSGMCHAGRIKHHLRQHIERPESTILFVGYQAEGTLGRRIVNREPLVRIHGRDYRVRAEVRQLAGLSGHADRPGLLAWIGSLRAPPERVFLTHGDEDSALSLAAAIRERFGYRVEAPRYGDVAEGE